MYYSPWPPILTAWCVGVACGWAWMFALHGTVIDGGVATVMMTGATLGFSAWMIQYKVRTQDQLFERFVADAAAAIRDEVHVLLKVCEMEYWEDPSTQGTVMLGQVARLSTSLKVFQKGSPYTEIRSYGARVRIEMLEDEVTNQFELLASEAKILAKHQSVGVINVAREKLTRAARRILEDCEEVCAVLGLDRPAPSDDVVQDWIASTITAKAALAAE